MRVLLIGSGGREHALAWLLAQSEKCAALYAAPGNAGIEECAECLPLKDTDIDGIVAFAREKEIDLVVIGPEAPLVAGLADALEKAGVRAFGPSAKAAQLEGSKGFMKDLCARYGIPTAAYGRFTDPEAAKAYIRGQGAPIVVKADGLAAGKGVIIAETIEQAEKAVDDMAAGAFGAAGEEIVIEEFLNGEELSYFALADGNTVMGLQTAQDYKRALDGDQGPNTGGMGAYSPAHMASPELNEKIFTTIIEPVFTAMNIEGCPFKGVLYAGIMLDKNGEPKVLEFNVRFGDPECQPLLMRFKGDLLRLLDGTASGRLAEVSDEIDWRRGTAVCVVMAANGYPGPYEKNTVINRLDVAGHLPDVKIFHAGTARDQDGSIVNTGGRTLGVTAFGHTVREAQEMAYKAIDRIDWKDGYCRRDIAWRALKAA